MEAVLQAQRTAASAHPAPTGTQRKADLDRLLKAMLLRQNQAVQAVSHDFGCRSAQETLLTEIFTTASAVRYARAHVSQWMRPKRRGVPWILQPGRAWLEPQPLGVVGIISPWNFPINLALIPLVAAIAAGNRVMLKPSEFTPATAEWLRELLTAAFPQEQVAVITGDAEVGREFSSLPFDHLLFTGSTAVGREIMKAASANLTPVTLELGGKSPALIAPSAAMNEAASAIAYGKLTNAGQICIAPDYVLVPRTQMRPFVDAFCAAARGFYPEGTGCPEYTAIINERHHARLQGYTDEARARGVEVLEPLGTNAAGRKFAPVLLVDPPDDLHAMQEEIFGPVLPVKPYDTLDQAIAFINARPRPLALYLFTRDRESQRQVLQRTISGSVAINDTLTQFAVDSLPFGGVGASGMGRYHGREGFETFSHMKPVYQPRWFNPAALFRPPLNRLQQRIGRFLIGS